MTIARHFRPPEQSFFLFGPRGTGKSTWLRQVYPRALVLDLLQPALYRRLEAHPEHLGELIAAAPDVATVVIDEVQRVPELLTVVHAQIEQERPRQFVLTGSSARKLRRGGVDLLAGRALNKSLHPFMASELPSFVLAEALELGMLPLVRDSAVPHEVLDAYAGLYLETEVKAEGWVRNVGNFARFLEAVSFSHGGMLNVAEVARECEVERKTVAGYLEVLEDLLLAFRVPVFSRRARRKTVASPKLYLFDAGIYRTLRPRGPLDRPQEIDGMAFEGLVAQHLRAWIAYSSFDCKLYYWRTTAGSEVDFIVYGGDGFWAIEVKNASRVRSQDLSSLKRFRQDYPECEPLLIYRGEDRLYIDGILCLPGQDFLRGLHPSQLHLATPP